MSVSDMSAQESTAAESEKSHSTRSCLGLSRASSLMAARMSVDEDVSQIWQDLPIAESLLNSSRLRRQKLGKPAESSNMVVVLIVSVQSLLSPTGHRRQCSTTRMLMFLRCWKQCDDRIVQIRSLCFRLTMCRARSDRVAEGPRFSDRIVCVSMVSSKPITTTSWPNIETCCAWCWLLLGSYEQPTCTVPRQAHETQKNAQRLSCRRAVLCPDGSSPAATQRAV